MLDKKNTLWVSPPSGEWTGAAAGPEEISWNSRLLQHTNGGICCFFFMFTAVQTWWSKLCAGRLTHGRVTPPTHYLTNTISVAILISPFWTWLQHRLTSFIYSVHQNLEGFQTMRYPSSTVGASVATRNDSSVHRTRCSLWNGRADGEF